jgi:esterase/lipase superfamily enzyme
MRTEYQRWYSPHLGRDMEIKVYGHWGQPFIVFPCSMGRFFDYENLGMINAIKSYIDAGKIKIYAVDSIDSESWYNFSISPSSRNNRHEAYDQYISKEVVPYIRHDCRSDLGVMVNGCSMGAYHSLNFFLKHPDLCQGVLALSGLYRLDCPEFGLAAGQVDEVYFNSPISYLPHLNDQNLLQQYRCKTIILCAGQGDWEDEAVADTRAVGDLLLDKGVSAWVDLWGTDVNHDWPWWYRQMNYFLGRLYGS